jgi:hypothetical protein
MNIREFLSSWTRSDTPRGLREGSAVWMRYINDEVRLACQEKHWGHQVRRKWSVRERPVSESLVDDYEWKLIPDATSELLEEPSREFEQGMYYVLSLDARADKFLFQHDTSRCGSFGLHWQRTTFTEIHLSPMVFDVALGFTGREFPAFDARLLDPPKEGWLRSHLLAVTRFGPNSFSYT